MRQTFNRGPTGAYEIKSEFSSRLNNNSDNVLSRALSVVTQVLDVYDCTLGLLRIGPFNYDPLRGVDLWLAQSDQFILQHLSTSPEVELPHFVSQVTRKNCV